MEGSQSAGGDSEAPYWIQDKNRAYSSACRIHHGQPSWYFSFVGSKAEDVRHSVLEVSDASGNESEGEVRNPSHNDDSAEKMNCSDDDDDEPEEWPESEWSESEWPESEWPESEKSSEPEKHEISHPAEQAAEQADGPITQEALLHHAGLPKIDEVPELEGASETGGVLMPSLSSFGAGFVESSCSEHGSHNGNMSSTAGSVRSTSGSSLEEFHVPDAPLTPPTLNRVEPSERMGWGPAPHLRKRTGVLKGTDDSNDKPAPRPLQSSTFPRVYHVSRV